MSIACPADILLPRVGDMTAWSVIACDQFTSQGEYWDAAEKRVGEAPSALRLMLPEAWLGTPRAQGSEERIADTMRRYLDEGVFTEQKNCFIYLERTQPDGRVRRGLMAALDLERYDFAPGQDAHPRHRGHGGGPSAAAGAHPPPRRAGDAPCDGADGRQGRQGAGPAGESPP